MLRATCGLGAVQSGRTLNRLGRRLLFAGGGVGGGGASWQEVSCVNQAVCWPSAGRALTVS